MSLTEFLNARLDEDEAVARAAVGIAALGTQTGRWEFDKHRGVGSLVFAVTSNGGKTQAADLTTAWEPDERGAHIARHNPARVLAEVEAKRQILALASRGDILSEEDSEALLRILASVYADHPDFPEG